MAGIPAFCEKCKFVFDSNFIGTIGNGASVHISGSGISCPKCGGMAKILDGLYKSVGGVIEILVEHQSYEDLKKILDIFEDAKKQELGREEIIKKIEKDAPELSRLIGILPKTRTELYHFIMIIIMVITLWINSGKKCFTKSEVKQHFDVTINNYYQLDNEKSAKSKIGIKETEGNGLKVGRNKPCPCGSGKKYKKCCGR